MIITLLATNIGYDTDGPGILTALELPENMEVQVDLDIKGFEDINRQVCNQISDATGWLVVSYQLEGYTPQPADRTGKQHAKKLQKDGVHKMLKKLIESLLNDDEGISSDAYALLLEYLNAVGETDLLAEVNNRVKSCNDRYYVI